MRNDTPDSSDIMKKFMDDISLSSSTERKAQIMAAAEKFANASEKERAQLAPLLIEGQNAGIPLPQQTQAALKKYITENDQSAKNTKNAFASFNTEDPIIAQEDSRKATEATSAEKNRDEKTAADKAKAEEEAKKKLEEIAKAEDPEKELLEELTAAEISLVQAAQKVKQLSDTERELRILANAAAIAEQNAQKNAVEATEQANALSQKAKAAEEKLTSLESKKEALDEKITSVAQNLEKLEKLLTDTKSMLEKEKKAPRTKTNKKIIVELKKTIENLELQVRTTKTTLTELKQTQKDIEETLSNASEEKLDCFTLLKQMLEICEARAAELKEQAALRKEKEREATEALKTKIEAENNQKLAQERVEALNNKLKKTDAPHLENVTNNEPPSNAAVQTDNSALIATADEGVTNAKGLTTYNTTEGFAAAANTSDNISAPMIPTPTPPTPST